MLAAIRQQVTVQPGGVIEIRSPDLQPGASAEVIVLVDQHAAAPPRRSLESFIGAGKALFANADEVDSHVRELRDEPKRKVVSRESGAERSTPSPGTPGEGGGEGSSIGHG